MIVLESNLDESVNFIHEVDGGVLESRFVHRPGADFFICYLSSQTGCKQACRFCHLTATGQTNDRDATSDELLMQAIAVLDHAAKVGAPRKVSFSFMARGEPFANQCIQYNWEQIVHKLGTAAKLRNMEYNFKVSTIMPKDAWLNPRWFCQDNLTLYYSLYSFNPAFRRKWLPRAGDPVEALKKLRDWRPAGEGKDVVIHHTFIEGENDSLLDTWKSVGIVHYFLPETRFNLVRYNPPNDKSRESPKIEKLFEIWKEAFPNSQIIDRVGFDVKASCGMFINE